MNALADAQMALPVPLDSGATEGVGGPTGLVGPRPDALARPRARRGVLVIADAVCALAATLVDLSLGLVIALPLVWIGFIMLNRGYESRLVPVGAEDLSRVSRAGLQLAVTGAALVWMLGWSTGRAELVIVVGITTGLSLGHRMLGGTLARWLRIQGTTSARRVVIAGHSHQADLVVAELARSRTCGFEVAGICLPHAEAGLDTDLPVSTGLDQLLALVRQESADAVIVLPCDHVTPQTLRRLTWDLEGEDAQLFVAPGVVDVDESRSTIAYAGGLQMVHIRPAELRGARHVLKTVVERTLALAAVVALAPFFLTVMLAIVIDSRGNPIYRQQRVGRDGREFTMLKLRTMSADADRRLAELTEQNEAGGVLFKIHTDPRITRLGRLLRRYSIDELPQLCNVVLGHMSLVGPRPALPVEVERYEPDAHRRLAVRPGVTGLWQVSGRSDLSWEESVRLDLAYVDNWSLWADVKIILRTARAVVSHVGAY